MRTMEKLGLPISYNLITETMTNWKNEQSVGDLDFKKYLDLMELRRTDPDAYYKKLNSYKRDKLEARNSKWKNKVFSLQNILSTSKLSSSSKQNSQLLSKKQKNTQNISPIKLRHKLRHENHQQKQFNSTVINTDKKMNFEHDSDFEDFEQDEEEFSPFSQKFNKKPDYGKLDKNYSKMNGPSINI
ncbi:hypothetical protein ABPG72_014940, partial [Tetrahymena utriculariae]